MAVAPSVPSAAPACACGPSEPFNVAAWWRIGVGALIVANSITLSLAVDTSEVSATDARTINLVLLGLALAAAAVLGWPLARNAARSLRQGRITIEAMFVAGLAGAMAASLLSLVRGDGETYFEVVSILLVVYAFGQQLSAQVQERALRATQQWAPAVTTCVVLAEDGREQEIRVTELEAGDRVVVPPGGAIAADGVVEEGEAFVREAEMTGEPFAVVRRPGDAVWAGTWCVDARLVVRATAAGGKRRIDRIVEAVERARLTPTSLQNQADRLVGRFLPAVLVVAGATFVGWWPAVGWARALFNAMAVLLIACPCALGLATPLALWAALARLASRGLVVRDGDAVERLAAVDAAVFDKTGTITERSATLVDLVVEPPAGLDRDAVLRLVAAVERAAQHPVADAFVGLGGGDGGVVVRRLRVLPAAGVAAVVADARLGEELEVVIGACDRVGAGAEAAWAALRDRLRGGGSAHEIAVLVNGAPAALALVDERLRASWPETLKTLRDEGLETLVMTGDRSERALLTAADDIQASLTPEDKLARVRALRAAGRRVLFVGDGVNDAAAMAASDVAVGAASGAELAAEVAAITWYGEDLRSVAWAVGVARASVRTIRSNLVLAAGYNLVGISLAAAGVLHPVAAALLMMSSSVVVTWRAIGGLDGEEPLPTMGSDRGKEEGMGTLTKEVA